MSNKIAVSSVLSRKRTKKLITSSDHFNNLCDATPLTSTEAINKSPDGISSYVTSTVAAPTSSKNEIHLQQVGLNEIHQLESFMDKLIENRIQPILNNLCTKIEDLTCKLDDVMKKFIESIPVQIQQADTPIGNTQIQQADTPIGNTQIQQVDNQVQPIDITTNNTQQDVPDSSSSSDI